MQKHVHAEFEDEQNFVQGEIKKGKYACLLGRVLIHNIHNHSHADLSFFSSLHVFFIIKFCTSMLLYIIYAFIVLVQFFVCMLLIFV